MLHFLRFLDAVTHESQLFDECVACCNVYMTRDTGTVNTIHSRLSHLAFHLRDLIIIIYLSFLLYQEAVTMTSQKRYISVTRGSVDRLLSVSSISQLFRLLQTINYVSPRTPSMLTVSLFSQVRFDLRFHLL